MSIDHAELELFRDNVKRFLENEIRPHYEQWEKDSWMPREIWNKLGENGLLCVDQPEQYGGVGVPFQYSMVILNEMAKMGLASLATGVSVHSDICAPYIEHLAIESVKSVWLPKLASGDAVAAIGMTEPGAGSDLAGIRTTAVRDGDFYVVNGSKTFITNGQHANLVVVAVKTDAAAGAKGVSLVVVEVDGLAGLRRGRILERLGQKTLDTAELFFDAVRVPAEDLLETGIGIYLRGLGLISPDR